ncbi:hypothetical protein EVAR_29651_1 [Eumeta japonica]|uniref:Uncharacterized protein n=1 Tax=Eumeta variegata TaxID=151549 RepID=A0A4C1W6R4_EUMVA|nr:hypothetical protein EVAR_29651_1 [Eumeta japonica]
MVMEPTQAGRRLWPLSPRLWRRSSDYSKFIYESRKTIIDLKSIDENDIRNHVPPDLLRSRSFNRDRREVDKERIEVRYSVDIKRDPDAKVNNDKKRWSVCSKKPPVKEARRTEEAVRLRPRSQPRQPRPNSLQLLLCPSGSGHYISDTWRYTRVRSRR